LKVEITACGRYLNNVDSRSAVHRTAPNCLLLLQQQASRLVVGVAGLRDLAHQRTHQLLLHL